MGGWFGFATFVARNDLSDEGTLTPAHTGPLALFYERIFEAFVCGVWTRVRTATKKTVCSVSHTVGKPHTLLAMFVCKLSVRVANVTLLIHVKMVSRKVDISLCARSAVCFWLLLSSNC